MRKRARSLVEALLGGWGPVEGYQHVSSGGRPARAIPHDGMPAYESATGALHVMEALVVTQASKGELIFTPRSYGMAVLRAPAGDLTALHDDPAAIWSWRPLLYDAARIDGGVWRLGSQQELVWRVGLAQFGQHAADQQEEAGRYFGELLMGLVRRYGSPDRIKKNSRKRFARACDEFLNELQARPWTPPFREADARAEKLLRECLSPQQLLDLAALGGFYVRGRINQLYFVEVANGFGIADPVTREQTVSMCLHPDEWIPHADVALATKLAINSGEKGEIELLEAARPRVLPPGRKADDRDRVAARLERRYQL